MDEGYVEEGIAPSSAPIPPPPSSGVRLRGEGRRPASLEASLREEPPPIPAAQLRRIIDAYLPLVRRLVKQLARRLPANVLEDDLVSAGLAGLLDSLRRNGGDQGVTFSWYASTRIRGAIYDELRAQDWLSRRARARLTAATDATGPAAVFVSLDDVTPTEATDHLATIGEDPFEAAESHSEHHALARAIAQLPARERQIVGRHYFDGVKFKDLGAELGVSEPRVSQLHTRALNRLRTLLPRVQSPPKLLARPVSGASTA